MSALIGNDILDSLLAQYPQTRGKIKKIQLVNEGFSDASVWLVDIDARSPNYANGFAFAKFDRANRCINEISRHRAARANKKIKDYVPEIVYPDYETNFRDQEWGFVLYLPAQNVSGSTTLASLLRKSNRTQRDKLVLQIQNLISYIVAPWYSDMIENRQSRTDVDLFLVFSRAFNIGDEEKPESEQRLASLGKRLFENFGITEENASLVIDLGTNLEVPNPAAFIKFLGSRHFNVRGYLVPNHGDMHCGNIVCRQDRFSGNLKNEIPWLIDFAQFSQEAIPFFDLSTLEFDILARTLPSLTGNDFQEWLTFLNYLFSGSIVPNGDPPGYMNSTHWDLIKPIRSFIMGTIENMEKNALGIGNELRKLWLLSAICVGLQFSRRSKVPPGIRSAGLLYSAMAVKQLTKEMGLNFHGEACKLLWKEGMGLTADLTETSVFSISNSLELSSTYDFDDVTIPPQPYLAHRYHYGKQPFFDREKETNILDNWFSNSSENTLVLQAIGGQGKTALVWHWFNILVKNQKQKMDGAFWWSFYSDDGRFMDNFVTHMLAYITKTDLAVVAKENRVNRERKLLDSLSKNSNYLIVMDGLERILLAYKPETGSRISEKSLDASLVDAAKRKQELNYCANPADGNFLQKLVSALSRSRLIITSRLPIGELEDRAGRPMPNVMFMPLSGLDDEGTLAVMRFYGVEGNHEKILSFTRQFGNHGLFVSVIAASIAKKRGLYATFDEWFDQNGKQLNLHQLDLIQQQNMVLDYALKDLAEEPLKVLKQLSVFRFPASFELLKMANPLLNIDDVSSEDPLFALKDSVDGENGEKVSRLSSLLTFKNVAARLNEGLKSEVMAAESLDPLNNDAIILSGDQTVLMLKIAGKEDLALLEFVNTAISKSQKLAASHLLEHFSDLSSMFDYENIERLKAAAYKLQKELENEVFELSSDTFQIVMGGNQIIHKLLIHDASNEAFKDLLNKAIEKSQVIAAEYLLRFSETNNLTRLPDHFIEQGIPALDRALAELVDRGLVQVDFSQNSYDLHPIVRAYIYETMMNKEKVESQIRKRKAFLSIDPIANDKVHALSDLQREIEIYYSYVEAGDTKDALFYFVSRLYPILFVKLGQTSEAAKLIEPLMETLETIIGDLDVQQQVNVLQVSSEVIRNRERIKSRSFKEEAILRAVSGNNLPLIVESLRYLSIDYLRSDEIYRSFRTDKLNLKLAKTIKYDYGIAENYLALYLRYILIGYTDRAEILRPQIEQTLRKVDEESSNYLASVLKRYISWKDLFLKRKVPPFLLEEYELLSPETDVDDQRDMLHILGEFALQERDYKSSLHYFNSLLDVNRETVEDPSIPLGGLARTYFGSGNKSLAIDLVERGADDLSAAIIFAEMGEVDKAYYHAMGAYKKAWADGPPYSYCWDLRKAAVVFREVGRDLPSLPSFKDKKREIPEVFAMKQIREIIAAASRGAGD